VRFGGFLLGWRFRHTPYDLTHQKQLQVNLRHLPAAGKERMAITESGQPSVISIKVDFVKPSEAHNIDDSRTFWGLSQGHLNHARYKSLAVDVRKPT
jgi:hypothetical protein